MIGGGAGKVLAILNWGGGGGSTFYMGARTNVTLANPALRGAQKVSYPRFSNYMYSPQTLPVMTVPSVHQMHIGGSRGGGGGAIWGSEKTTYPPPLTSSKG